MRGKMKKITHVLGTKRLTADVFATAELVRCLGRRFSFDIIIPYGAEYRDMLLGIGARVIALDASDGLSLTGVRSFFEFFKANPADIVHTHASVAARIGARLSGAAKCISTRSASRLASGGRLRARAYNRITDLTLCIGTVTRDALISEGVRRDSIVAMEPPMAEPDERKHFFEPRFVSSLPLCEGFGHATALRALAILSKDLDASITFLGDGPLRGELKLLASRLGVGGRVEFCENETTTIVYNSAKMIPLLTHEEHWEMPIELYVGTFFTPVVSNIPENRELLSGIGEFYIRGDAFSLARSMRRAALSGVSLLPPVTSYGVELHAGIYEALLSI